MINICKNANLNQLMITSGAASPSHAGGDGNSNALVVVSDAVTSNSSSGQHGIVHKSTRTMLIYLWVKFLQTYQGIESEEDDWNQTLSSDNDILDDSIEENLLDHFVKLLKMSYAVEFASLTSASSSSSVVGDAGTKYLFSIHGTILNEMLSVFLKFRVLRDCYTTSEINDLPDAIALIQIIYSKQVELGELFVNNWELAQSFGKEEIAAMFPLVDFIQTMIQFTSSEPIHLLKVMHALIASSSTAPAILERIATVLFTILNQSTNYITNEPFEFLNKILLEYDIAVGNVEYDVKDIGNSTSKPICQQPQQPQPPQSPQSPQPQQRFGTTLQEKFQMLNLSYLWNGAKQPKELVMKEMNVNNQGIFSFDYGQHH
jgi:hypothetical protein